MTKIDRLKQAFSKHIHIPWRQDAAPEERVIFCVYDEREELHLRVHIDDFKIETEKAGWQWAQFDLTDSFALWMSKQKYKTQYFKQPHKLTAATMSSYADALQAAFTQFLADQQANEKTVIALTGVASLFGFLKVNTVVATFSPLVRGRLVVFFPGNYENNNYRLLDAYDGWNYLAVPITADME